MSMCIIRVFFLAHMITHCLLMSTHMLALQIWDHMTEFPAIIILIQQKFFRHIPKSTSIILTPSSSWHCARLSSVLERSRI